MKKRYLFALTLFCFNVQALEMYQWTDEEGTAHVSETPPPEGVEYSTMNIDVPESPSIPAEQDADSIEFGENASEELDENGENKVEKARKVLEEENCKISQSNMQNLRNNANLVVADEKNPGSFIKMTEDVRQQKIQQTQADIDLYCKKAEDEETDDVDINIETEVQTGE